MTEESIGETSVKTQTEDALDATTFDVAAWVAGVKPVRRATTVYGRVDLLADMDLLHEQINAAKIEEDYARVTELRRKCEKVAETIQASAVDIVVEGWGADRLKQFHDQLKEVDVEREDAYLMQIAAQIVEPVGFTADLVRQLFEVSPQQGNQIFGIVSQANNAKVDVSVPS